MVTSRNDKTFQFRGLSTDTKPTENIENGSLFIEMDTSKVYSFDKENKVWGILDISGGGGGGGTTYTAGDNITISADNVISATDTTYSAGDGIDITNNKISVDNTVAKKTDLNDFITKTETYTEEFTFHLKDGTTVTKTFVLEH